MSFFSQLQRWYWRADLHHDLGSRTHAAGFFLTVEKDGKVEKEKKSVKGTYMRSIYVIILTPIYRRSVPPCAVDQHFLPFVCQSIPKRPYNECQARQLRHWILVRPVGFVECLAVTHTRCPQRVQSNPLFPRSTRSSRCSDQHTFFTLCSSDHQGEIL